MAHQTVKAGHEQLVDRLNRVPQGAPPADVLYSILEMLFSEREAALAGLAGWEHDPKRDAISRRSEFADFSEAFAFMARASLLAEQMDHHPEWYNIYNRVEVTLATHDAGGVTQKDIDLAAFMDRVAG